MGSYRSFVSIGVKSLETYLTDMPMRRKIDETAKLMGEWPLAPGATLGSSVRARGIFPEIRARLPAELRKLLHI
jgi:hypothetical protein